MKLDILVFGAHPDDAELACGGTIIKEVDKGKKVGVIDLTQGELGTRGNKELRMLESNKAKDILGLSMRHNMNFKDGFFKDDENNKIELIKQIRKYRPDIILTNAVSDRHPDHPRSSQITVDACFLSGLLKIDTHQDIWRPRSIYHYIQYNNITPDIVIDITEQMEKKIESIKAYSSQFYNPESKEEDTIISTKDFLDSIIYRAKDLGRQSNCKYAEGFISHQMLRPDSLFNFQ
tara:strand:- start:3972 stop:4673 length:702 start_codon:yes stop_codon:yes gene_type:complete